MDSLYYNPKAHNLEEVVKHDYSSGCYEFDYRVVWRHFLTGLLYTARNSGCSCPAPFENYYSIEDLDIVNEDCLIMLQREGLPGEDIDEIKKLMNKALPNKSSDEFDEATF